MSRFFLAVLALIIIYLTNAIGKGSSSNSTTTRGRATRRSRGSQLGDAERQYREQQKNFQLRASERGSIPPATKLSSEFYPPSREHLAAEAPVEPLTPAQKQAQETVAISQGYIDKFRAINEKITDEEMSDMISDIEKVTAEIFVSIKGDVEKTAIVRRFLSYYLPTTNKLLETYLQFETKSVQTPNITQTQEKIKETLNLLLEAFYKLHDSLYDEDAMDVMNEISAMESILSSEGLITASNDDIASFLEKGL
ncbi:MAG: 5-bromo-4-chloroindolyl phosphate hydrolysis family protein [Eubacteriaceae bacterium]|nr:5-bromo-4-chloroindolyl phosphate hydrolysis family protein [Eubacteriaceae bacterium]